MGKISIIIPCYNAEKYLSQCIESVIHQTFTDLEVLCVNDGSTDCTLEVLKNYAEQDARIKVINQVNGGISNARNRALQYAEGEYVLFLDSDDWLDRDALSLLYDDCLRYDMVCFSYFREYNSRSEVKNFELEGVTDSQFLQRRIIGQVGKELAGPENFDAYCTVWAKVYRRKILENVTFVDLAEIGTWEDGLFNLEVLNNKISVKILNRPYYHYRKINTDSLTSNYREGLFRKWKTKFKILEEFVRDKPIIYKQALRNRKCITFLNLGFNEMNGSQGLLRKYKNLKSILNDREYSEAFADFKIKFLPAHWKFFYFLCKVKCFSGVLFMLIIIHKIINRKKK